MKSTTASSEKASPASVARVVFVCRTCDRNARPKPDGLSAGEELATTIKAQVGDDGLSVRRVACLNGCLRPCNVAFRGAGRFTYRFSRIVQKDAAAIVAFGATYWATPDGAVDADRIPRELRAKMTVCTPPPGRWQ